MDVERLPLKGVTVIDCGQVIAGPTAAMLLGDFGADVIKVENPVGGDQVRFFGKEKDGVSLFSKLLSRNKKSITLNLRDPEGQDLLCRLIAATQADVLVESFRPGTLERWNLGYDRLSAVRPELILVRFSGFGQTGPYRERPGFGTLAEAMSGFAHITGEADGPPTLPQFPLADSVAALNAAMGVMIALYEREVNGGTGQVLDVSLLEPLFSMLGIYIVEYDQLGLIARRQGNRTASAPRNTYRTKDGRWVAIAASTQSIAARVFAVMGRSELLDDPRFATNRDRLTHVEEVDAIVGAWVAERTQADVIEILTAAHVAVAPVLHAGDLVEDPHLVERGAIVSVDDEELGAVRMPDVQPRLSQTPGRIRSAGPPLGSSTDEILGDRLGLSTDELAELRGRGVI
jgi:crotonobetainyl-CoA:carnitine CoA-transferase CaiB-like acyl-CoA transferase